MSKTRELYKKAIKIIPGGTQLLSKRPEMHLPDYWPAYFQQAKGCEVWDLDGNPYLDMSNMGVGSCILGYADPDVNAAVKNAIDLGTMTTLNCPEEVELAGILCALHPWAKLVRYARTGGEAMAIAVRIARAKTNKDMVLFCGYHGWHDWYLSANLSNDAALDGHLLPGLSPKGTPRALFQTTVPFQYNDKVGFSTLVKKYQGKIAAVVMEPLRYNYPQNGFLETIRETTEMEGIVLVFDEITAGWRLNDGGAHLKFGVNPDMAVFGKGMSNGYPMSAVIGTRPVMEAAQETFISSTYWTERIGPTAALAVIEKMNANRVVDHLIKTGEKMMDAWKSSAKKHGLAIEISGMPSLCHFTFKDTNALVLRTLFTQFMLEKGILATTAFYASFAHKTKHLERYQKALDETFERISEIMKEGNQEKYLKGPVCHSGFKRLV